MKLSVKKNGRLTYLYAVKGYRDGRIMAHFLTCFLSLLIMRIMEKKVNRAGHKFSVREISFTLAGMDFGSVPGEGFVPAYTRATLTDRLHGSAGFKADTQIITKQKERRNSWLHVNDRKQGTRKSSTRKRKVCVSVSGKIIFNY